VSKIKFPSVVSTFAFITIRLPTLLKGIIQDGESLVTTGSRSSLLSLLPASNMESGKDDELSKTFMVCLSPAVKNAMERAVIYINRCGKNILAGYTIKVDFVPARELPPG
jgi:hypothetical protein